MQNKELCSQFITWYFNDFGQSRIFQQMNSVAEESPWHREDSIGIHTNMVVMNYVASVNDHWSKETLIGALAVAFHDVGKPAAAEKNGEKFKPERGSYSSMAGHEIISARGWEDYAVKNWKKLTELFSLQPFDIYSVSWLIEYHTGAWKLKNKEKQKRLALTAMLATEPFVFSNMLLADTYGRISDDAEEKRRNINDWVIHFHQSLPISSIPSQRESDQPILIVPIGASGCGKSTYRSNALRDDVEHYSLDSLRLRWYSDDYAEAFRLSCDDSQFGKKAQDEFMTLIKSGKDIYVDNTNTSKKRRAWYINEAHRKGYFVQAVLFPCSMQTVIERQSTRLDKTVPEQAVIQQYSNTQMPQYGEFDSVIVVGDNLPS